MTRIFDRIFRYRQSDGRTPWEDYFTEILAAILEKHEKLAAEFVEYLADRDDIQRIDIQTQKLFSDLGCQPDVYVTAHDSVGGRHVLIMENKIDAPEGEDQLARYTKLLEQKEQSADSRILVYITQYSGSDFDGESTHVKFRHLYWYQVYRWINRYVNGSDNQEASDRELITELLNLMEDWKMDGDLTCDNLRTAIIYHTSVRDTLMAIIYQTWNQSDIKRIHRFYGKWSSGSYYLGQESPTLECFGIRIGMGYWFDRKDSQWNAARLELPSATVVIKQATGYPDTKLERPSSPNPWTQDRGYTGPAGLWVKKLNREPCHGESLSDFYRKFFQEAFEEINVALKCAEKNSTA